jgi:hypothetical protein
LPSCVAVEVGEFAGQFAVGFVDGLLVNVQFHQARFKVQGQGGAVADGFFEAVAAHVAAFIFFGAECGKGVVVTPVDGRPRQTKEKGSG